MARAKSTVHRSGPERRASALDLRQNLDQVGPRLRAAREARGLSLREIARRINVSPSFVSQVETAKASPSVGTLYSLVNELGLSLDEVMSEDGEANGATRNLEAGTAIAGLELPWANVPATSWPRVDAPLQPKQGRPTIKLSGVTWERLTHEDDPFVDFLYVTYEPGSASCSEDKLMRHGGREYGHVVSGKIDVQVGFDLFELGPGDSLHFDSTTPHRLANPYDEPCVALWVVVARKSDSRVTAPPDPESNHLPGLI